VDFAKGVGRGAFNLVYEPLATVYDLEQVAYQVGRQVLTGKSDDVQFTSAIGKAAAQGAGTGEILLEGLKGAVMTPVRLAQAVYAGNAEAAGEETFNLAVLLATARSGGKVAAGTEAGAVEAAAGVVSRTERAVQAGEAGRFADLQARAVVGDELTPHHMPQAAAEFTSRSEGGALVMTAEELALTRIYLSKGATVARAEAGLSFREVLARDIRDVRGIVGTRYNEGLLNLIRYYKENFPTLIKKP